MVNRLYDSPELKEILYAILFAGKEISYNELNPAVGTAAIQEKKQFIYAECLNMDLLLERFVVHFDNLYGDQSETFKEEDGRRYFLLYHQAHHQWRWKLLRGI